VNLIGSGGYSPIFRNSASKKYVSGSVPWYLPHAYGLGANVGDVACISLRDSNSPSVIDLPTLPSATTYQEST